MPRVLRSRAFDAFLPDSEPGEELPNARLLPLECITANPYQARQVFAPDKLEELTASIREHGVLEPILVQAVAAGQYRILAGERRYRAATAAGLTHLPALIREDLSEEAAAFITATENLQWADLDLEDEARQFAYLLQLTGLSQRGLAEKLGVSKDYLYRRLLLLQHPELLAAVRIGTLSQREAIQQALHGSAAELPAPTWGGYPVGQTAPTGDPRPATLHPIHNPDPQVEGAVSHSATFSHPSSSSADSFPVPASAGVVSHSATFTYPGSSLSVPDAPAMDAVPTLIERDDLDTLTGDADRDLGPLPPTVPRWRYVEEAQRALRRIDARTIPSGERPAWLRQVAVLEALVTDLKRRLIALEGEHPDAL